MNWDDELKNLEGWHFGGKGSGLEDSLAKLVCTGEKTATCSWYESYAYEGAPLPTVGSRSFIMNSKDEPVYIIEITYVEIKLFTDVAEDFARAQGEADKAYQYWRTSHERFFERYAKDSGLEWNSQTQSVVCERFRVLHVFDSK